MQFSCAQCSTRYAVPDDKVRGKRVRTKCRKCGAEIVVDGIMLAGLAPEPAVPAPKPAVAARPTPHAGTQSPARVEEPWTVAISRTDQRKMLTAEVVEAYAAGTITDSTLVWKNGMDRWQAPFEIPSIALGLLARGLEPKPRMPDQRAKTEPPPPSASASTDWDDEATRVFDAAVVAEDLVAPQIPAPKPAAPQAPKPTAKASKAPVPAAAKPKPPAPAAAPPEAVEPAKSPAAEAPEWDDDDEATKMFAPNRSLLAARLPRVQPGAKPGSMKSRAPPVPPRRSTPAPGSKPPAAPSVPPPPPRPAPLAPSPTKAIEPEPNEKAIPTVRPPPGPATDNPFGFEDEATAVITADRARALLEEQLEKPAPAQANETPMSFGTDTESPKAPAGGAAERGAEPRAKRESIRTYDDLVEKGPTIVVAEGEKKRTSSRPPPPVSPAPLPPPPVPSSPAAPPSSRDFGGIQHERTRVVRARKKPGGPFFWLALVVALAAAAGAGYYASRLLDKSHSQERR